MTSIIWFFDLLFMTWAFWPIVFTLPIIGYYNISTDRDRENFSFGPSVLFAIAALAVVWHFPTLRNFALDWKMDLLLVGCYIVAGFFLSLYKWFVIIMDFRKVDTKGQFEKLKKEVEARKETERNYTYSAKDLFLRYGENAKLTVDVNGDGTYSIYPNWKEYPIKTWWYYWPVFLLQIPLDLLKRAIDLSLSWMKNLFNNVAKKFAVRA